MIKLGLVGVGRGSMMFEFCDMFGEAEIAAVCDTNPDALKRTEKRLRNPRISYTTDYAEFLTKDFDAVFLANYATQHAPLAIQAMRAGKDVISEVLPVETMAQAVELIECVEETGRRYIYAENYCYMPAVAEMTKKIRAGELGNFEYGEGEYLHNCESGWFRYTGGNPEHWRNTMSAFYYCTHSVGPLLHASGLRPVKVSGFECPFNERMARMGSKAGHTAVEMITLENGAIVKSAHGIGCSRTSVWFSFYGSKGRMESARDDAHAGAATRLYENLDGGQADRVIDNGLGESFSHAGSDFVFLHNACESLSGRPADIIDVYEAIDMWMPGFFGYLSAMNDNRAEQIPNLRNKEERERYRNDHRCTTSPEAGKDLLPSYSKGTPEIDPAVYEKQREEAEIFNKTRYNKPQLFMHWDNDGTPEQEVILPKGITLETLPERRDPVGDWLSVIEYGLTPPGQTKECYDVYLTKWPNFRPEYCYFLVSEGKAIGTVTAIVDREKKEGYIHMVALNSDFRGRGLGNALTTIAMNVMKREGMRLVRLSTDDWRYAAIRSYLRAGFVPDCPTQEYEKRWKDIAPILRWRRPEC